MADSQTHPRVLNPWVLHFQKLGLELKCPSCLNFYNKPILLPCNHIFCSSCVSISNMFGSKCTLCNCPYVVQELRQAPYMENVVNIYRNMDTAFSMQKVNSDGGKVREHNLPDPLAKGLIDPSQSGFSLVGNKRVQVPSNLSHSALPNLGKDPLMHCNSRLITGERQNEVLAVDTNPAELSPGSSPFSGVRQGVESDSRDAGSSDDTAEKSLTKSKCVKRVLDNEAPQEDNKFSESCLKKQKQQNEGHLPLSVPPPPTCFEMNSKSVCSADKPPALESDSTSSVNFICAFCQTWKITEGSGPMQHFANGIQVFGSEAGRSNVIHVHRRCIEWAPQIFFESDNVVKNVEKELARAAKLKCTSCGLKGAALGCYAKSCRRTYHVPCASQIQACRWDSEDFIMLCPTHASHKFPSEKYKKPAMKVCTTSTQIYDEQKNSPKTHFWVASPTGAKNWVLCGSALSANEKAMLVKFAKLCGATVTRAWTPDVTHVIAATNANGACSRTLKVLMAILNGRWILTTEWVKACLQAKSCVDEESYEIRLDNHGCCDGPKTGRLRVSSNAPRLFSSLKFLFTGEFVPAYKQDIQDLIIAVGGTIFETKEQVFEMNNELTTTLVVYNGDALTDTEDACQVLHRQVEAQKMAVEVVGSRAIAHTWILDSIASCALQPFFL